jgi:hypothetical protein
MARRNSVGRRAIWAISLRCLTARPERVYLSCFHPDSPGSPPARDSPTCADPNAVWSTRKTKMCKLPQPRLESLIAYELTLANESPSNVHPPSKRPACGHLVQTCPKPVPQPRRSLAKHVGNEATRLTFHKCCAFQSVATVAMREPDCCSPRLIAERRRLARRDGPALNHEVLPSQLDTRVMKKGGSVPALPLNDAPRGRTLSGRSSARLARTRLQIHPQ